MANAAASTNKDLPPLPVEESMTVIRRTPVPVQQSTFYGSPPAVAVNQGIQYLPTGYTSQPMTRDNSKESDHSLLSAPATAGLGLLGTSLPTRDRPASSSIDIAAAHAMEFGRMGEWSNIVTTMTPTMPGLNMSQGIDAVQFGQMDPVRLEKARRRADEYARRGSQQKERENR